MSAEDDNEPGEGGDEMIAAEYVLGVLPAAERQAASARLEADAAFARHVDRWEAHLAPLGEAYGEVAPPASVKAAIDRRLFANAGETARRASAWSSLALWRTLAAAALAALLVTVALPFVAPQAPAPMLVASLAPQDSQVSYMVVVDRKVGQLALSHVSGDRAAGRDFELWMIEGKNAPVSLGVIPVGGTVRMPMPEKGSDQIEAGLVFAVSLEPQGGSPSGKPTGPVVALGELRTI